MEPLPPTPVNRMVATILGVVFGIGAQILFLIIATDIIGPIPPGFNMKLLEWVLLLLAPPVLSALFVRISPGSISDDFFKGVQLGSLIWFLKLLIALLV